MVREAVAFAGLPDPGETRLALQTAADRDALAMAAVVDGLSRLDPGRRGLTAADLIAKLKDTAPGPDWLADMREAVNDLCGKLDSRPLGYKLRHFARRNFGGRMIDKAGPDGGKSMRWAVVDVATGFSQAGTSPASPASPGSAGGDAGDAGDVLPGDESAAGFIPGDAWEEPA